MLWFGELQNMFSLCISVCLFNVVGGTTHMQWQEVGLLLESLGN